MKYGQWAKIPITISQATVKKGKKPSERKKDLNKLRKVFPNILAIEIERIYNESGENLETALLNLSSFEIIPENSCKNIELLEDMFEEVDKDYIQQVYGQCGEDISQATAFMIEASAEDEALGSDDNFGSQEIGYVNKEALNRRLNKSFGDMLADLFPNVDRDEALQVYLNSGRDMIKTFQILGATNVADFEEEPEKLMNPVTKYDEEYPANIGTPRTKVVRKGYWAKDQNNFFLDGNNVDAVKKIDILKKSFPAIDDVAVKEIFFQMGDNLQASIDKLKELFPLNYREVEVEKTIRIPYHSIQPLSKSEDYSSTDILDYHKPMSDSKFNENLELMQMSRKLHDVLYQTASRAAASGNFSDAKRLTIEGKKHFKTFRDVYMRTYREIFRRNNEKFGIDAIDLHGLQTEEALLMLDCFLRRARGQCRKVEVITVIEM